MLTEDNDGNREVLRRIARETGAMEQFRKIWRSKNVWTGTKINILKATMMSAVMFASDAWTLKKKDRYRLLAFEMKCYRRILRIKWGQKILNEEVCRGVRRKKNTIQEILEMKLNCFDTMYAG